VASGLATRLGFTLDDIEDLKIGVDELSAYLTGTQGRDGTLKVTFTLDGAQIRIDGKGDFSAGVKVRTELTTLSQKILETVVDSATLHEDGGSPAFSLAKSKSS